MKYFKVQKGYGDDYLEIDETELPMALRAQLTGRIAVFQSGTVAGNNIMSITPDYHKELGFKREYKLMEEDYKTLGKEKMRAYQDVLNAAAQQLTQPQLHG